MNDSAFPADLRDDLHRGLGTLGLDATLTRPTTPGARTIWGLGLGWYGIKF